MSTSPRECRRCCRGSRISPLGFPAKQTPNERVATASRSRRTTTLDYAGALGESGLNISPSAPARRSQPYTALIGSPPRHSALTIAVNKASTSAESLPPVISRTTLYSKRAILRRHQTARSWIQPRCLRRAPGSPKRGWNTGRDSSSVRTRWWQPGGLVELLPASTSSGCRS